MYKLFNLTGQVIQTYIVKDGEEKQVGISPYGFVYTESLTKTTSMYIDSRQIRSQACEDLA